jgi:hypothetical protein
VPLERIFILSVVEILPRKLHSSSRMGDPAIELINFLLGSLILPSGDAIAYLPKEKIWIAGDLVDSPVPYLYGGFPIE